jgi:hypothetical protein
LGKKDKQVFKKLIASSGLSEEAAEELWKWYDPAEKKGIASF